MFVSLRIRERIRTAIIMGLMLVSLTMVGLLGHQTYLAVSSQRQLVDDVLKDYSLLAADELIRRSAMVAGYGFYPVLGRLAQVPMAMPLPDRKALSTLSEFEDDEERENLSRAVNLARAFFRFSPASNQFEFEGDSLPQGIAEELKTHISAVEFRGEPERAARTLHLGSDEQFNFIYAFVEGGNVAERFIVGLWVDDQQAIGWLKFMINSRPLLPRSLTEGKFTSPQFVNDKVYIKLVAGDVVVFSQGEFSSGTILVTRDFNNAPADIFGNMRVHLGIDPELASSLIIGGLPESRLPIIYGSTAAVVGSLWVVAALFMGFALVMLYRERSLAYLRADFVSRVSHELRTPLAQIMMFAQTLLLDRVRTDEARKRSLQVIDKEARRLSHLVDNILQFSSAERGQTDVRMARTPLYPLVREIVDQFRPMMKDGRLVISSDVGDDVEVTLDVDAFRQMFVNLLDNAVKYSPPGGNVDVRLFTGEGRVNVAVEDRGPGIPDSEKDRIWEPYYRTSTMTDQAIGGTGLGLAVVNELARLQAAHVSTSAREGGGARFTIGFELAA
ncbi:MAG: HAMP domain-containing sensor histidine kinase [Proteobacteria bacterium]|nr:HAMP domain-containing sensor histidine kinase [Pseudomonadota bacterium]MDA1301429.1 HAMP domain-containing sensor histidine kinase [Pseudomonadota bacterium]